MTTDELANRLFQAIDAMDTRAFLGFLADDVEFRFGNAEALKGKSAVSAAVSQFFASIHGVQHSFSTLCADGGHVICHGTVTYTRHDATTLSVPFANLLALRDGLITQYLIFVDVSALYAGN